jgi:hypothetical protein
MILPREEINKYIDCINHLKTAYPLTDIHVSPFEVIFNLFKYTPNPDYRGVYSLEGASYRPPSTNSFKLETRSRNMIPEKGEVVPAKLSLLMYRQAYANIGPRVLVDQMNLSGISRSLLLPVLQSDSCGEEQVRLVLELYESDKRCLLGYCIPNTVGNGNIMQDIKAAIYKYKIKAIKVHPNITGIDLSNSSGRRRIERILEACQDTDLPLIIHGGLSPVLKNFQSRRFAALEYIAKIDWGITSIPVVISHAGMMGHSITEMESELIPLLKKMLAKHDNIFIDISALNLDALCLILKQIDHNRIIFGSDAFYFPQWIAIIKLLLALKESVSDEEDAFIQIAGINPDKHIFRQDKLC